MRNALQHPLPCASQGHANSLALIIVAVLIVAGILYAAPQTALPAKGNLTLAQRNCQRLPNEMINPYLWWVSCEVGYIITSQEKSVFKGLRTDDEREEFIEQFWERRNPEPGSLENIFKQNYYRRIVRANEAFTTAIPGWRTDRGRIYTVYGPPDEIELHPHGGIIRWSEGQNDVETVPYPFVRWFYRAMDGVGQNQVLIFADSTSAGDFRLAMSPEDRDVPLRVYHHDSEQAEAPKISVESFLRPLHPPVPAKFPDLRAAIISGKLSPNPISFQVQTYAFPSTDETVLAVLTVQLPTQELQYQERNGAVQASIDVYGQIQSLGGHIVNAFEKTVAIGFHNDGSTKVENHNLVFEEFLSLRPGRYRMSLALKDEASGRTGMLIAGLEVPIFSSRLCISAPLMLADSVEPNMPPANDLEPLVIGNTKVLPNLSQVFPRQGTLGAYLQIYGVGLDSYTHKPNLHVDYEVLKDGKPLIEEPEDPARLAGASTEFTIAKNIPLKTLEPGTYTLQINIADNVGKKTITPSTIFYVR